MPEHDVDGHHQDCPGDHHRGDREPEQHVPPPPRDSRQPVGHQCVGQHRAHHPQPGDIQGVQGIPQERDEAELVTLVEDRARVVFEHQARGQQPRRHDHRLLDRLQGSGEHPDQGEQEQQRSDDKDQVNRQVGKLVLRFHEAPP